MFELRTSAWERWVSGAPIFCSSQTVDHRVGLGMYDAECPILMMRLYADESYSEEPEFTVVGMAVAKTSRWRRLDEEWNAACRFAGVPYIHAIELQQRKKHFRNFPRDKQNELEKLLERAVRHIHFASTVRLDRDQYEDEYVQLFSEKDRSKKESLYTVCFRLALLKTLAQMSEKDWRPRGKSEVDVILEASHKAGPCLTVFEAFRESGIFNVRLGNFSTGDKKIPGLNVADFSAYRGNRYERTSVPTIGSATELRYTDARHQSDGPPFLQLNVNEKDLRLCKDMVLNPNYREIFVAELPS